MVWKNGFSLISVAKLLNFLLRSAKKEKYLVIDTHVGGLLQAEDADTVDTIDTRETWL